MLMTPTKMRLVSRTRAVTSPRAAVRLTRFDDRVQHHGGADAG